MGLGGIRMEAAGAGAGSPPPSPIVDGSANIAAPIDVSSLLSGTERTGSGRNVMLEPRRRAQVYARLVQDFTSLQGALTASTARGEELQAQLAASKAEARSQAEGHAAAMAGAEAAREGLEADCTLQVFFANGRALETDRSGDYHTRSTRGRKLHSSKQVFAPPLSKTTKSLPILQNILPCPP